VTFDRIKHTVLVVDPSANNRTQLCECLSQLPEIQAIAAGDGAQAMRLFRERPPSLVLLDISLHDTDSLTLARDMRTGNARTNRMASPAGRRLSSFPP
jgi:CheY-like chemotaxis protein